MEKHVFFSQLKVSLNYVLWSQLFQFFLRVSGERSHCRAKITVKFPQPQQIQISI